MLQVDHHSGNIERHSEMVEYYHVEHEEYWLENTVNLLGIVDACWSAFAAEVERHVDLISVDRYGASCYAICHTHSLCI